MFPLSATLGTRQLKESSPISKFSRNSVFETNIWIIFAYTQGIKTICKSCGSLLNPWQSMRLWSSLRHHNHRFSDQIWWCDHVLNLHEIRFQITTILNRQSCQPEAAGYNLCRETILDVLFVNETRLGLDIFYTLESLCYLKNSF